MADSEGREQVKVWISKYALSQGVYEEDGVTLSTGDRNFAWKGALFVKLGRDAHYTEAEAMAAAEAMRKKKIAALHKQIKKLEGMSFVPAKKGGAA